MKKKNKVGGVTLPEFKTYYKATVNKCVCHWQKKKKKQTEPQNRIENLDIDYINIVNISLTKEKSKIQKGQRQSSQQMMLEKLDIYMQKINLDTVLAHFTKFN